MKKLLLTIVFLAASLVSYDHNITPVKLFAQPSPLPVQVKDTSQYSPYQIDSIIDNVLIKHGLSEYTRTLIISQARVESGEYTSRLFQKHNNLFAMMHPSRRPTRSRGAAGYAEGRSGYASFRRIEDSVEDLVLYLKYYKEFRDYYTTREYVVTLKLLRYFEAPKEMYISSMQFQHRQQIRKPQFPIIPKDTITTAQWQ